MPFGYECVKFGTCRVGAATVIQPVCTWDNIINRKHENVSDPQPLHSALDLMEDGPDGTKIMRIKLMPRRTIPKRGKRESKYFSQTVEE